MWVIRNGIRAYEGEEILLLARKIEPVPEGTVEVTTGDAAGANVEGVPEALYEWCTTVEVFELKMKAILEEIRKKEEEERLKLQRVEEERKELEYDLRPLTPNAWVSLGMYFHLVSLPRQLSMQLPSCMCSVSIFHSVIRSSLVFSSSSSSPCRAAVVVCFMLKSGTYMCDCHLIDCFLSFFLSHPPLPPPPPPLNASLNRI